MISVIDRLLRGNYTDQDALRGGSIQAPVSSLAMACLLLGAIYGASMGLFSGLLREGGSGWVQVAASAVKVPLLFLSTLLVTFPSLYVVSALARSRLRAADTLKLLLVTIAVTMALLASLAPVTAFFTLSTHSYSFMILLNVFMFAVSGLVGLGFLMRALGPILGEEQDSIRMESEGGDELDGTVERQIRRPRTGGPSRMVFRTWAVIYGVVGTQMGWIMRPFIGSPELEFTWFRERESNVLGGILSALADMLGA